MIFIDKKRSFLGVDWSSRSGNKMFWLALISALIVLAESILKPMGVTFNFGLLEADLANIVEAAFGVLIIIGVIMNPQSDGIRDENFK